MQDRNACSYLAAVFLLCHLLYAVHDLCEVGPLQLHDAGSRHIYAPCLTLPQAPRAVGMSLVLHDSCICIIEIVGQMVCWNNGRLNNGRSHGIAVQSVQDTYWCNTHKLQWQKLLHVLQAHAQAQQGACTVHQQAINILLTLT